MPTSRKQQTRAVLRNNLQLNLVKVLARGAEFTRLSVFCTTRANPLTNLNP